MVFTDSLNINKCCLFSCSKFFTARVYAKLLHNDPYGRISIMQFFNYVMRKGEELYLDLCSTVFIFLTEHLEHLLSPPVWLHQTRIGLSLYDVAGQGYLRESVSYILFFSIRREIMVCCSLETVG